MIAIAIILYPPRQIFARSRSRWALAAPLHPGDVFWMLRIRQARTLSRLNVASSEGTEFLDVGHARLANACLRFDRGGYQYGHA